MDKTKEMEHKELDKLKEKFISFLDDNEVHPIDGISIMLGMSMYVMFDILKLTEDQIRGLMSTYIDKYIASKHD